MLADAFEVTACPPVGMADVSMQRKSGWKGPRALELAEQGGLPIPPEKNTWILHDGGVIARLGFTELFFEHAVESDWLSQLPKADAEGAIPVQRNDASLLLFGERLYELLAQICAYRFEAGMASSRTVVMTQMTGISITAIVIATAPVPALRLWCDPAYAPSLWRSIEPITQELSGGPVGLAELNRFGVPYV